MEEENGAPPAYHQSASVSGLGPLSSLFLALPLNRDASRFGLESRQLYAQRSDPRLLDSHLQR